MVLINAPYLENERGDTPFWEGFLAKVDLYLTSW